MKRFELISRRDGTFRGEGVIFPDGVGAVHQYRWKRLKFGVREIRNEKDLQDYLNKQNLTIRDRDTTLLYDKD